MRLNVGGRIVPVESSEPVATTPAPGVIPHVIIVGFGLSGRAALNEIIEQNISYAVIESNPETVSRCTKGGVNIIRGDARHPAILRQAGIDRATDVMVTLPNDQATLEIVQEARRI